MVEESWLETNFNEDYEINSLIVDVDGYEGPLDVLLTLARTQKVDVRKSPSLCWPNNIFSS